MRAPRSPAVTSRTGRSPAPTWRRGRSPSFELAEASVGPAALANNSVIGVHILGTTIETFDVKNDSLIAADQKDEPGVEFAGGNQSVPAILVVRSVAVTAPADGYVTVWASGTFFFNGSGIADCSITGGSPAVDFDALIRAQGNNNFIPFAGTRTFEVSEATTTTFMLMCTSAGAISAQDTQMSAISCRRGIEGVSSGSWNGQN